MVTSRRAQSMIEFMIAVVILGLAIVPMYGIFSKSRETAMKSKLAFMALHVARGKLEELRQIPFERLDEVISRYAEWTPVEGNIFRDTIDTRNIGGATTYGALNDDDALKYPEEYSRILLRIHAEDIPSPLGPQKPVRLKKVILEYYFQEKGETPEAGRMKHFGKIETIIGSLNVE